MDVNLRDPVGEVPFTPSAFILLGDFQEV
jgi:hypothetical protein